MKYDNIKQLMNNTPVIKLNNLVDETMADVYIKLENMNLTGSVKIRAAFQMIMDAKKNGILKEGMKLIEPTSGNTGIALAYMANLLGHEITIVMPETMSIESVE